MNRFFTSTLTRVSFFVIFLGFTNPLNAQINTEPESDERPLLKTGDGLGLMAPDSTYFLNFRFRMQNRAGFTTAGGDDFSIDEYEMRVRRLRLRIDGFLLNPKLGFYIQLSFSRADQDWDNSLTPNVVRDAMIFYSVNRKLLLGFGQGKLPGNRQRVVSSGQLQFADRSILNSTFNIDRDFGFRVQYDDKIGGMNYNFKSVLSSGTGRNSSPSDAGLGYTARAEILPFGKFTNGGDYFEGDLMREKTPKLSVGFTASHIQNANRTGGTIGRELYEYRPMTTYFADALFKFNGFAVMAEYARRISDNPFTFSPTNQLRYIYTGYGTNVQTSYIFSNNVEFALRYAHINPESELSLLQTDIQSFLFGMTKYVLSHRIKVQGNVGYTIAGKNAQLSNFGNSWTAVFQVELGI